MYKEFTKAKTAAKTITYESNQLKQVVLDTVAKASSLVGSTLGPNGKVVLIERQENLPPFVTKDGITVFNSMAFADPTAQAVLEAARDSSAKTNVEAGDGTTTATILAEALIRLGFQYLEEHPHLSTQKVMRELETCFNTVIAPFIKKNSLKITNDNDKDLLYKVALIATNNDVEMATAVLNCFEMVGHNGNVTIAEVAGVGGFDVEKIEGFPVARGFEDSCGRFVEEFINDKGNYRTVLDRPHFLLYNGKINDITSLLPLIEKVGTASDASNGDKAYSPNVVVVAHHFSESVLAILANNFRNPSTINILPLKTPMTQQTNSPYHFLLDLAAFTGSTVFDPLSNPVEKAELSDLGLDTMSVFEFYRYRSLILGEPDEAILMIRVEELEQQHRQPESQLDQEITAERMALLTGGIARLKVLGSSEAELKEKRHRVEDAVASVKGALREGVLPGCGKTLLTLSAGLTASSNQSEAVKKIMGAAFKTPFIRIMTNGGYNESEIKDIWQNIIHEKQSFFHTYDALNFKYGNAVELGVIDSAAAVLMAIKNSLSVAKMLMGLSGIVVFKRDTELEIAESKNYSAERAAIEAALRDQENEKWEVPF